MSMESGRTRPYPCRSIARRAFQSGKNCSTRAQNSFWWLGCTKWQYSCTITYSTAARGCSASREASVIRFFSILHTPHRLVMSRTCSWGGWPPSTPAKAGYTFWLMGSNNARHSSFEGGGQSCCLRAARATCCFAPITQPIRWATKASAWSALTLMGTLTATVPSRRTRRFRFFTFFRTSSYSNPATRRIWPAILLFHPLAKFSDLFIVSHPFPVWLVKSSYLTNFPRKAWPFLFRIGTGNLLTSTISSAIIVIAAESPQNTEGSSLRSVFFCRTKVTVA